MLKQLAESTGVKLGDLMQPIRVALTGGTVSEPVPELLAVVGKNESLSRIAARYRIDGQHPCRLAGDPVLRRRDLGGQLDVRQRHLRHPRKRRRRSSRARRR